MATWLFPPIWDTLGLLAIPSAHRSLGKGGILKVKVHELHGKSTSDLLLCIA